MQEKIGWQQVKWLFVVCKALDIHISKIIWLKHHQKERERKKSFNSFVSFLKCWKQCFYGLKDEVKKMLPFRPIYLRHQSKKETFLSIFSFSTHSLKLSTLILLMWSPFCTLSSYAYHVYGLSQIPRSMIIIIKLLRIKWKEKFCRKISIRVFFSANTLNLLIEWKKVDKLRQTDTRKLTYRFYKM